jgi:hypothetical protein
VTSKELQIIADWMCQCDHKQAKHPANNVYKDNTLIVERKCLVKGCSCKRFIYAKQ